MIRQHWRELRFWRWWWRNRAPVGVRLATGLLLLGGVLVAGLLAADRLSAAKGEPGPSAVLTYVETVQRMVTVREKGKVVRKLVPVVRRVKVLSKPETVLQTRTDFRTVELTTAGTVHTVVRKVVRRVPVVRTHLVTVSGATRTVSVTRVRPTTAVETRTSSQTVTSQQTVTNTHSTTVTQTRTQTDTQTETQTTTVEVATTVEVPVTTTVEVTVEVPTTVTETVTTTGP